MKAFALLFALSPLALAAQPRPTLELYADCLAECVARELNDVSASIIFAPDAKPGFKRELDLRLQAALLAKGFRVRESPSENALDLRYDIQSARATLEDVGAKVRRVVSLSIFLRLASNGEIMLVKASSAERVDTLWFAEIERLNDPRYPETTIEPRRAWLDALLAPTLATLSIGVIVYLFFSVRSN